MKTGAELVVVIAGRYRSKEKRYLAEELRVVLQESRSDSRCDVTERGIVNRKVVRATLSPRYRVRQGSVGLQRLNTDFH